MQEIDRPIELGNLELSYFVTDHTRLGWQQSGEALKSALNQFSLVIPEYFPPEYQSLKKLPVIGPYLADLDARDNYLFHQLAEFCQSEGKDILVVDPSFNASFLALRYSPHTALGTVAAIGGVALIAREMRQGRRGFLHFGLAAASISLLAATGTNLKGPEQLMNELAHWKMPYEDPLRDSSSAEQTVRFGHSLPERTRGLIVTTRKHWEEFKKFALNDNLRTQTLSQFDPLRKIPTFDSFFTTRYYPGGSYHQLTEETKVLK